LDGFAQELKSVRTNATMILTVTTRFNDFPCTPKWIVGGASSLRVGQKLVGGRRCCVFKMLVSVGPLWIYWNGFSGLDVLSHFGGPAGLVLYILFLSRCGSCGVS